MGFKDDTIVKQNLEMIQAENDKVLHPSASLLNKRPIQITAFYNVDPYKSEVDGGFANVQSWIGLDSPIKYQKINNLIGYGFTEDQKTKSKNEHEGFIYEKVGVTYLLADTFEPFEKSFFKTIVDGEMFLHLVTSVEEVADTLKPSYKLTHQPYIPKSDPKYDLIEKQVVDNMMYMDENRGTGHKVIINMDTYNKLIENINMIRLLQSMYIKTFFNVKYNAFVAEDGDTLLYSSFLTEFIIKHRLLYNEKNDMNIYVSHEVVLDKGFQNDYLDTIYYDVENKLSVLKDVVFSKSSYDNSSKFSFFNKFEFEKKPISVLDYDLDIIDNIGNYNVDQLKNFIHRIINDPNDKYFKIIRAQGVDLTMFEEFKKFKLKTTDISAFILMPILIYKLKFDTGEATKDAYDSTIENMFGGGGYQ